jgi:PHD-finger
LTELLLFHHHVGHYIYCIVCGYTGDLFCCDGCPNVLHGECIGLKEIPEGDWFCEECEREKSYGVTKCCKPREEISSLTCSKNLPFGRVSFDDNIFSSLVDLISEVREIRLREITVPLVTTDKAVVADNMNNNGDISDKRLQNLPLTTSNSPPMKRGRGRPRKYQLDHDDATGQLKRPRITQDHLSSENTQLVNNKKSDSQTLSAVTFPKRNPIIFVDSITSYACTGFRPRIYTHPSRLVCSTNIISGNDYH